MSNFIEIKDRHRTVLINLNNVTGIVSTREGNSEFLVSLCNGNRCYITKEDYEAIKAKLIDNNSKE